jgi:PAS domain S-box-containing protein
MNDQDKSREQLIAELQALRQRVADQDARLIQTQQFEADQRKINDSLPVLVATAGLDGYYQEVNAAFKRILGWSEEESLSRPFLEFIVPEDRASAIETFARLKSGVPAINFLDRNICKDGSHRWINWTVIPVPDRNIVFGIGHDITEIKQAEEARERAETIVRESERKLAMLLSNLPGVAYRCKVDPAWTVEFLSDGYVALTDLDNAEQMGRPGTRYVDLIHPHDRQRAARIVQEAVAAKKQFQLEYRLRTASGREKWIWEQGSGVYSTTGEPEAIEGFTTDITERKRAEEELARNKAILQAAIESLPFEFFAVGSDGRYILQNAILREHYGDAIGNRPEDYAPDEHTRQLWLDNNRRAFAGERVEGEVEAHVGDKTLHYYNVITPIRDGDEICGILGINVDITARKQAEQQLQQANERLEQRVLERTAKLTEAKERLQAEVEQRRTAEQQLEIFRRFAEAATQGFGMADLDGQITYVNPFLARLVGVQQAEDAIGKHVATYYPSDYLPRREREVLPALRRGEHWQGEQRMVFPDGLMHPTIHSIFPVHDEHGALLCTAAVITDITELKRAEEALRQSYEELRTIYECMVDGLLIADIATKKFVKANRAISEMLGYSPEELVSMSVRDIYPPEELPAVLAAFQTQVEFGVCRADNLLMLRRDGTVFSVDMTANRLVYNDRLCLIGFFRDVTERRQAEEKLKTEQRALRRMLVASDRDRQLTTYELHDGVAQQILGAMMYFQSLDLSDAGEPKGPETAYLEGMKALRRAAAEIRWVMNRLRTPVLDKFGLAEAIEDVAAQLRLAPDAPEIECRHDVKFKRLERTLENSLFCIGQEAMTNACRHSRSEKVQVTLIQEGDGVTLEVRDWGIGFDPDAVQENRFGLEGIRERARILGGKLSIETKPGAGTVVRVKFPVLEAVTEA